LVPCNRFLLFYNHSIWTDGRLLKSSSIGKRVFVDERNVEEACSCYNSMLKESWIPSVPAYCALVKGLCKIREINAAISLVKDFLGNVENRSSEFKYTLTILEACRSKSPEKVISVMEDIIIVGYSMEEIIYSAIMYGSASMQVQLKRDRFSLL
jgi:pentatricopeptide repeat protein